MSKEDFSRKRDAIKRAVEAGDLEAAGRMMRAIKRQYPNGPIKDPVEAWVSAGSNLVKVGKEAIESFEGYSPFQDPKEPPQDGLSERVNQALLDKAVPGVFETGTELVGDLVAHKVSNIPLVGEEAYELGRDFIQSVGQSPPVQLGSKIIKAGSEAVGPEVSQAIRRGTTLAAISPSKMVTGSGSNLYRKRSGKKLHEGVARRYLPEQPHIDTRTHVGQPKGVFRRTKIELGGRDLNMAKALERVPGFNPDAPYAKMLPKIAATLEEVKDGLKAKLSASQAQATVGLLKSRVNEKMKETLAALSERGIEGAKAAEVLAPINRFRLALDDLMAKKGGKLTAEDIHTLRQNFDKGRPSEAPFAPSSYASLTGKVERDIRNAMNEIVEELVPGAADDLLIESGLIRASRIGRDRSWAEGNTALSRTIQSGEEVTGIGPAHTGAGAVHNVASPPGALGTSTSLIGGAARRLGGGQRILIQKALDALNNKGSLTASELALRANLVAALEEEEGG